MGRAEPIHKTSFKSRLALGVPTVPNNPISRQGPYPVQSIQHRCSWQTQKWVSNATIFEKWRKFVEYLPLSSINVYNQLSPANKEKLKPAAQEFQETHDKNEVSLRG